MSATTASSSFWDSGWLRLLALLVAIGGIALFVYTNQDIVSAWIGARTGGPPSAYQQCLSERMAAVDKMAKAAGYTTKQKELAVIRAQEFCHNKTGM